MKLQYQATWHPKHLCAIHNNNMIVNFVKLPCSYIEAYLQADLHQILLAVAVFTSGDAHDL